MSVARGGLQKGSAEGQRKLLRVTDIFIILVKDIGRKWWNQISFWSHLFLCAVEKSWKGFHDLSLLGQLKIRVTPGERR